LFKESAFPLLLPNEVRTLPSAVTESKWEKKLSEKNYLGVWGEPMAAGV
jgi:hypothetical protein